LKCSFESDDILGTIFVHRDERVETQEFKNKAGGAKGSKFAMTGTRKRERRKGNREGGIESDKYLLPAPYMYF
jgi:hypothetical protein